MEDDEEDDDQDLLMQEIINEARVRLAIPTAEDHEDPFEQVVRGLKAQEQKLSAFETLLQAEAEGPKVIAFYVADYIGSRDIEEEGCGHSDVLQRAKALLDSCDRRARFLKPEEKEEVTLDDNDPVFGITQQRKKLFEEFKSNELARRVEKEATRQQKVEDVAKQLALMKEQHTILQSEMEIEQTRRLEEIGREGEMKLKLVEEQLALEKQNLMDNVYIRYRQDGQSPRVPKSYQGFARAIQQAIVSCEPRGEADLTTKVDDNKTESTTLEFKEIQEGYTREEDICCLENLTSASEALDSNSEDVPLAACLPVTVEEAFSRASRDDLRRIFQDCIRNIERFGISSVISRYPARIQMVLENMHRVLVCQVNSGYDFGDDVLQKSLGVIEDQTVSSVQKKVSRLIRKVLRLAMSMVGNNLPFTHKWKRLEREAKQIGTQLALVHYARQNENDAILIQTGVLASLDIALEHNLDERQQHLTESLNVDVVESCLITNQQIQAEPEAVLEPEVAESIEEVIRPEEGTTSNEHDECKEHEDSEIDISKEKADIVVDAGHLDKSVPEPLTVQDRCHSEVEVVTVYETPSLVQSVNHGSEEIISHLESQSECCEGEEAEAEACFGHNFVVEEFCEGKVIEDQEVYVVTKIQAFVRGHLCRIRYRQLQAEAYRSCCICRVQAFWRGSRIRRLGVLQRLKKQKLRQDNSATKIQALWKGRNMKNRFNRALARSKYIDDDDCDYAALDCILITMEDTAAYDQDEASLVVPPTREEATVPIWEPHGSSGTEQVLSESYNSDIMDRPKFPSETPTPSDIENVPDVVENQVVPHPAFDNSKHCDTGAPLGDTAIVPCDSQEDAAGVTSSNLETEQKRKEYISAIAKDWGFKNEKTVKQFLKACSKKRPSKDDTSNSALQGQCSSFVSLECRYVLDPDKRRSKRKPDMKL